MYMKFVCVCACVHKVDVHVYMCLHVSQSMRGASWVMTRRHGRAGRLVRKTPTYWNEGGMTSTTTVFSLGCLWRNLYSSNRRDGAAEILQAERHWLSASRLQETIVKEHEILASWQGKVCPPAV